MSASRTMDYPEVSLAMRCLGLRPRQWSRMRRNSHKLRYHADRPVLEGLMAKDHARITDDTTKTWQMTAQGIQQLKLQIGEF